MQYAIKSLVSSKRTLQDFEVVDRRDDLGLLYVREVLVSSVKCHYTGVEGEVHVYDVEPFEVFYNRMH